MHFNFLADPPQEIEENKRIKQQWLEKLGTLQEVTLPDFARISREITKRARQSQIIQGKTDYEEIFFNALKKNEHEIVHGLLQAQYVSVDSVRDYHSTNASDRWAPLGLLLFSTDSGWVTPAMVDGYKTFRILLEHGANVDKVIKEVFNDAQTIKLQNHERKELKTGVAVDISHVYETTNGKLNTVFLSRQDDHENTYVLLFENMRKVRSLAFFAKGEMILREYANDAIYYQSVGRPLPANSVDEASHWFAESYRYHPETAQELLQRARDTKKGFNYGYSQDALAALNECFSRISPELTLEAANTVFLHL